MKTIIILGVLLLASLSQALPFKDNIDSDEEYIPATDIESFHLLPFLRAIMTSDEIQWAVMRNWLINKGILKRKQPKKKLQYIRLFWIAFYEKTHMIIDLNFFWKLRTSDLK